MFRDASLAALVAALALAAPGAAQAQQAAASTQLKGPSVGATVYGPDDSVVGTISAMTADSVTVDTGKNKVAMPAKSFGEGSKGPRLSVTKEQLDKMYEDAVAKAQADAAAKLASLLQPGAEVHGKAGAVIATIKEVDADTVTLTAASGDVRFPRNGIGLSNDGLSIGWTAEEFEAAVKAAH